MRLNLKFEGKDWSKKSKLLKQSKLLVITRFEFLFLIKINFLDYYFFSLHSRLGFIFF